jgi:UDP-N-acetylmuramoyl-tripeptide--D-alanyl-D-alanine ligase
MRSYALSELAGPLAARLSGSDVRISSVSTDSRSIRAGELFVALKGENFDGHSFLDTVREAGAGALVVSEPVETSLPTLQVEDTELALGQLGAFNRLQFRGTLVGITGSCGKTSCKNMLAAILGSQDRTLATEGNLNNEIGLPLTLLRLEPGHRYAVIEMGAGKPGDIAYLCELARPEVSILLNAMPAHLERMGSLQAIAETKGAILAALGSGGCAIYPADSEFTPLWRELAGSARRLEFGFQDTAPVHVSNLEVAADASAFRLHIDGESADVHLPLPGRHNVANAMAAAAAAVAAGVDIASVPDGLAAVPPQVGRLSRLQARGGIELIDDSYNANPASVKAAVDVLKVQTGRKLLVLGTMAELGEDAAALHAEVGAYAKAAGLDALWATGRHTALAVEAFGPGAEHFPDRDSLVAALPTYLRPGDVVLVKGSRSAGMERIVAGLLPPPANEEGN